MKKSILTALAILPLAALAQKPYSLSGNVKSLKAGDKVYLVYQADGAITTDSAIVANGTFAFNGSLTAPTRANLFLNKNLAANRPAPGEIVDMTSLYLEPSAIKLTATDSLKNAIISGSAVNDDNKKLGDLTKSLTDQMAAINSKYAALSADEKKAQQKELGDQYMALADQMKPIQLNFLKNNPNSYISLVTANQLISEPTLAAEVETAFNKLNPALKNSKPGTDLAQLIASGKKTAIGVMAMDFTQNDTNDKPVKLSDFKGKYVLVDFWASWCGPCREENPNVVKAYNTYKDKNFTVLGISLDQPGKKDAWLAAIEKDGLTWTHVSDLKFWNNEVAKLYGIRAIPANFLIDPTGKIIAKNIRGEELQTKLAEVLKSQSK